jgi:Cys-rich repeat protein
VRRLWLVLALALGCEGSRINKQALDEGCQRNVDCLYGLECVEAPAGQKAGKTCQFKSFGDCDQDGAAPSGQQQCLSGQKCRDGRCTVQCAAHKDCKEGEVCKIGVCQKGGRLSQQCLENRDCPWPETCFYGQCVTRSEALRCQTDLDCGVGSRCMNGRCQ